MSFARRNRSGDRRIKATLFVQAAAMVGESPLSDEANDRLWWTDLARGRLLSTDRASRTTHAQTLGRCLGGVVLRAGGGLTAALDGGVAAIRNGRVRRIADLGLLEGAERVNDAKCDPDGRLWIGVVGTQPPPAPGSLHLLADGGPRRVLDGLTFPNGFDWSPDGVTLYVSESHARRVSRFPFDARRGCLGAREPFVKLDGDDGLPDGLTVDAEGGVWVAIWGAGEVRCYSPAGELTATVACPVSQTSSCTLGGPDRRTLYITTAREGLDADALRAQPLAGSVFHARVPFAGLPPRRHADRA
jgi:sugar lactone lactonase YvrE